MKYSIELEIELPKERVTELISNPDNLVKWQQGFVGYRYISGTPGKKGAKTSLEYKMGSRKFELTETIEEINLPHSFVMIYQSKGVWNRHDDKFIEQDKGKTIWIAHNEFKLKGFMGIISVLMKGAFKKQSLKFMNDFKNFAEKGIEVGVSN